MTKSGQNFTVWSGDDTTLEVTVLDNDGNPVNLVSASLIWKVVTRQRSVLINKVSGSGITVTDAENGVCEIKINSSDTDPLSGTYRHELQMTQYGTTSTVMSGSITVQEDVVI